MRTALSPPPSGCCLALPAAAAAIAAFDNLLGVVVVGLLDVGPKAKLAPLTAGEGSRPSSFVVGKEAGEGLGANGGRHACFSLINPSRGGLAV